MKRILALFLCTVLIFACSLTVYAHPGGTDSKGGHTNHSTGKYHYHHGYSAHSHSDMDGDGDLDCPYNFVDKTQSTTSSSKNSTKTSSGYTSSTATSTVKTSSKKEEAIPEWIYFCGLVLLITIVALFRSNRQKDKQIQTLISSHNNEIANLKSKVSSALQEFYGNDYLLVLSRPPFGDSVGPDGFPRHVDNSGTRWGDKYTFYVANGYRKEQAFHRRSCRYAAKEINAYSIHRSRNHFTPCRSCSPSLPNIDWFNRYKELQRVLSLPEKK